MTLKQSLRDIGLFVVVLFVAAVSGVVALDYYRSPESYFGAKIWVPNHVTGSIVYVEYVRTIRETIKQTWHSETRPFPEQHKAKQFCRGNGTNLYQRGETKQILLTLHEYHGVKKCVLPPGTYKTYTCWQHRPLLVLKKVCVASPKFTVHPK